MREFTTGATRDDAQTKPDYRGFISPAVLKRYGEYMLSHQIQADGKLRDSDNWKKGIPQKEYLSSLLRHVVDVWALIERGPNYPVPISNGTYEGAVQDPLCAILFNAQGLLHERLLGRDVGVEPVPQRWPATPNTEFPSHGRLLGGGVGQVAPKIPTWAEWLKKTHSGHFPGCTTGINSKVCDYAGEYRKAYGADPK